ncbi:MAG: cytochrome c oxidase assembly protein [Actinomycetota bacterium]
MWQWRPHAHPEVVVLCAAMWFIYDHAIRVHRARTGEVATGAQRRRWTLGTLAILVAASWPIHDLAERSLYSVHMIQHMLITIVAPPLLITGAPAWMARALLPPRVMRAWRVVTKPSVALVQFNIILVFSHWPMIVNASVHSELLHFSLHLLLFASALVLWWPVFSPLVELPRLPYPKTMLYLFLQSIVPTVPASFLTFGDHPLYKAYIAMPKAWGISALTDQRTAGLIMKIGGGFIIWGIIAWAFFMWFRLERDGGLDALGWRDVEHSLSKVELKR